MYLIGNGKLIPFSDKTPFTDRGAVAVDGEMIIACGEFDALAEKYPDAELIDADGGVIMPGFIDLYACSRYTFAGHFKVPRYGRDEGFRLFDSFLWNIERALNHEDLIAAAYAFAINSIKHGVTTVFDHHCSPQCAIGSLRSLASVYRECGLRACLCYEVTDRFGARHAAASIRENIEFSEFCRDLNIRSLKSMIGIDSALTLGDETLKACIKANSAGIGYHANAALTMDEMYHSIRTRGVRPIMRLENEGVLSPASLVSGGIAVDHTELEVLKAHDCGLILTPQLAELTANAYAQTAEKAAREQLAGIGSAPFSRSVLDAAKRFAEQLLHSGEPAENMYSSAASALFDSNPRLASKVFAVPIGRLEAGAAADIIIVRPSVFVPPDAQGCFILRSSTACEMTMAAGKVLMREGRLTGFDESFYLKVFTRAASELIRRLNEIS